MSLLAAHLEQIAYSCEGIDSLPFPPPKIFTNALLSTHDITTLLRDTEPHERALFSVPAPPPPDKPSSSDPPPRSQRPSNTDPSSQDAASNKASRRRTIFNVSSGEVTTGPPTSRAHNPRRHTAVSAVLGPDLHETLRKGEVHPRGGDADVDVLLRGAEKLCGVYALPGAKSRIGELWGRKADLSSTLGYYEGKVVELEGALEEMNKDWRGGSDDGEGGDEAGLEGTLYGGAGGISTEEELRAEEEELRQLERKKRELQARLRSMERDLGGLDM